MARRTIRKRLSWFRFLFILALGGALGGAATFYLVRDRAAMTPAFTSAAELAASGGELGRMDRKQLESEVARLRRDLDDRDKQIADLMIQLKLQAEGSAASGVANRTH